MKSHSCSLRRLSAVFLLPFLLGAPAPKPLTAGDKATAVNELAQFYGFTGIELYKLDSRALNLAVADFDSDGDNDIVVIDNRSSSLRLFRQTENPGDATKTVSRVNEIQFDTRFENTSIPVDKLVSSLTTGDFNKDGRTDIAYVGSPDRLIIRYQPEEGVNDWTKSWSVRLPEIDPTTWIITAGDLNGDGRSDIAVLGKKVIYIAYQSDEGTMQPPVSLINTSSQLALLQAADLDGDGRTDLCYRATEGATRGLCARLQTSDGRLGPELRFDLSQPRSITLGDLDGQPGVEVLTIEERTGRVVVSRVRNDTEQQSPVPKRLVRFGIGDASSSQARSAAIGDIDGDTLADIVITDAENAQMLVYRQNGVDGLETAEAFPGLLDATAVCAIDVNGDGTQEVLVMSPTEALVGLSRFQDGRLTFPAPVAKAPEGFDPVTIQVLNSPRGPELLLLSKKGSGSRSEVQLQRFQPANEGEWKEVHRTSLPATTLGTRGANVLPLRRPGDDTDLALIVPSGAGNKGVTLIDGDPEDTPASPADLGITSPTQLYLHNGSLYVARESFARKLELSNGQWSVADQFNAGESKARISGVAVLDVDGRGDEEIVLVDTGIKQLRILRKESGLFRPWKEVDLGVLRHSASHVADMNGDGRDDLVLIGLQQFAVMYTGTASPELKEVTSYDTDRDESYPADVLVGDVNADGRADLAVIDNKLNGIRLLDFDSRKGLRQATRFRVFEEKRLVTKDTSRGTQPREGLIADVTGDGRKDLILLCHDRLIVYPQDDGHAADDDERTDDERTDDDDPTQDSAGSDQ